MLKMFLMLRKILPKTFITRRNDMKQRKRWRKIIFLTKALKKYSFFSWSFAYDFLNNVINVYQTKVFRTRFIVHSSNYLLFIKFNYVDMKVGIIGCFASFAYFPKMLIIIFYKKTFVILWILFILYSIISLWIIKLVYC